MRTSLLLTVLASIMIPSSVVAQQEDVFYRKFTVMSNGHVMIERYEPPSWTAGWQEVPFTQDRFTFLGPVRVCIRTDWQPDQPVVVMFLQADDPRQCGEP